MRVSKQRKIILEQLKKCSHHPGADELYVLVRKHLPRISLGTIYRNLELLAETGIIKKLEYGSGQKRFDGNTKPHYHFRCVLCDRIEDIPFKVNTITLDMNHPWVKKRIIKGSRLEFFGFCPGCTTGKDRSFPV